MSTFKQVANNASSTTATDLSTTGKTIVDLASGAGAEFPVTAGGGNPFWVTLWNGPSVDADPNAEKVLCSARTVDELSTSATTKTHTSPCNVAVLDVAENITDLQNAVTALQNQEMTEGTEATKPAANTVPVNTFYFATDSQILYYSDGTNWQFAMDMKEGIEGPQIMDHAGEVFIIAPGAAASSLVTSGATLTDDTVNYEWGGKSIKMVTSGNGSTNLVTLSLSQPIDLSEAVLKLGIEIDSFSTYNDFQIRISSDNFASANFDYCKPLYTGLSQRYIEPGIHEEITINRGGAAGNMSAGQWVQNGTGLASYKSVNAIRFKLVDNGGSAPMILRLGFLSYFQRPAKGIVSLTFDDSRLTTYTVAKPVMDACGLRGVSYAIMFNVLNSTLYPGAYMNAAQQIDLQDSAAWQVAAHAFTDVTGVAAHLNGYDSLSLHDGEIDVIQLKTALRQLHAQGIDDIAYPHGQWDLNLLGISNPNANVLGMMAKYFNTGRTTYANTIESYPAANRMKLRAYVVQSTDTAATILAMVNAAAVNKWWLILTFHNLVTTPSQSTDFSIANFTTLMPQIAAADVYVKTIAEVMKSGARSPSGGAGPRKFESPVLVNDANYTQGSNDDLIAYSALTAPRTVTPVAPSLLTNKQTVIKDASGNCSPTNTITIALSGVTIDGQSTLVLNRPYQSVSLYSDGVNLFTTAPTDVVDKSTNQSIGGTKTFTSEIVVPTPTNSGDAATKAYVDAVAQGLDSKPSVAAVATTNVTLSGAQTIDGVALTAGQRVLLTGQTTSSQNGLWVVQSGAWTRPTDFATGSTQLGAYVFAEAGTANANSGWVLTGTANITVDTTAQTWTQFSGAGEITAGTGLQKIGNALSIVASAILTAISGIASAPFSMNNQKITSLANGSAGSDAAALGQVPVVATVAPASASTQAAVIGSTGKFADAGHIHPRYDWQPTDHGLISWAYDPSGAVSSNTPLATAGTLYLVKLHVPVATTITNILAYLITVGGTLTSGQCFAALYQNGSLLGVTADQSTNWASGGGVGLKSMPIAGGPAAVAAGDIYVAFWFNGTTGPAFSRAGGTFALVNANLSSAQSRWGTANTGATTTAPSTLGTIAQAGNAYWAGVN